MAVTSPSSIQPAFGLWLPLVLVLQRPAQAVPLLLITLLSFLLLHLAPRDFLDPLRADPSVDFAELSLGGKLLDLGRHLLLPTLALSLTSFAGLQRITRGSFLDVLRQEYIQAARAQGIPEWRVIWLHALRNAVNPLITILGFEFANLLSGSNWPGLGKLLLEAVQVMAGLLLGAVMLIVGNLLADLLLMWVDPRIRPESLL